MAVKQKSGRFTRWKRSHTSRSVAIGKIYNKSTNTSTKPADLLLSAIQAEVAGDSGRWSDQSERQNGLEEIEI